MDVKAYHCCLATSQEWNRYFLAKIHYYHQTTSYSMLRPRCFQSFDNQRMTWMPEWYGEQQYSIKIMFSLDYSRKRFPKKGTLKVIPRVAMDEILDASRTTIGFPVKHSANQPSKYRQQAALEFLLESLSSICNSVHYLGKENTRTWFIDLRDGTEWVFKITSDATARFHTTSSRQPYYAW